MTRRLTAGPAGSGAGSAPNASEIPSTGPSTVQADLDTLFAQVAGLVIIDSAAKLEAEFPNVAGVHTIDKQTIWVSQTGAPIVLVAGRSVAVANPGSVCALGVSRVLLFGDVAGPLLHGELIVEGLTVLNVNPGGSDFALESLAGRFVKLVLTSLGQNAGVISNVLGGAIVEVSLVPAAPGAIGVTFDGVIGSVLVTVSSVITPGGVPYIGFSVVATCTVAIELRFESVALFAALATDSLLYVDVAATLPGGPPLPTNIVGFEVFACSLKGGANLFEPTGIDHTDIRVLSGSNTGGPSSQFVGDAVADTTVTATPTPITQVYVSSNAWEVVPSDNGPAAPPDDVTLAINPVVSQRHSVQITSRQVWSLQYDGPEDALFSVVRYKATADRAGGSASTVDVQLEANNGAGWVPLPGSMDTITLLSGDPREVSGNTLISVSDSGFELRLVSRTSNNATNTEWHRVQVSKGF